jgi:phosphatidylserine decarboxylase
MKNAHEFCHYGKTFHSRKFSFRQEKSGFHVTGTISRRISCDVRATVNQERVKQPARVLMQKSGGSAIDIVIKPTADPMATPQ